ncbi:MAG: hypothetical protein DRJ05_17680 [Bacteroidetes bacterium]|nr:MAG: hypothetical protein DRJ05_17680 [Bacteroidota bacterium]
MKPIQAIIVDDEPEALDILESLLTDFSDIEILSKDNSVDSALISILRYKPDIVFLDIDMPNKNGFELVQELKQLNLCPTIIFVTAYNNFAIDAIKCAAFDYLVKPVDIDDLQLCISRYKTDAEKGLFSDKVDDLLFCLKKEKIRFNTQKGLVFIGPDEIVYCAANGNYTDIFLKEKEGRQTITVGLGSLTDLLPDNFTRINRSIIINRNLLKEVNRKTMECKLETMSNELVFKVSKHSVRLL